MLLGARRRAGEMVVERRGRTEGREAKEVTTGYRYRRDQTLPSHSTDRPPSVRPAQRRPVPCRAARCLHRGGRVVAGAAKALQEKPAWTVSVQTTPMCPDSDALPVLLCLPPSPSCYLEPPVMHTVLPGARSRRCLGVLLGLPSSDRGNSGVCLLASP